MMNISGLFEAQKLIGAVRRILAAAAMAMEFAGRTQPPSAGKVPAHGHAPYPTTGSGQLLLPGIAEPYRWDLTPCRNNRKLQ